MGELVSNPKAVAEAIGELNSKILKISGSVSHTFSVGTANGRANADITFSPSLPNGYIPISYSLESLSNAYGVTFGAMRKINNVWKVQMLNADTNVSNEVSATLNVLCVKE